MHTRRALLGSATLRVIPELFATKAVDIIEPDVCRAGGVTECRKIAILAELHVG